LFLHLNTHQTKGFRVGEPEVSPNAKDAATLKKCTEKVKFSRITISFTVTSPGRLFRSVKKPENFNFKFLIIVPG
jgi:hypothetical protein